MQKIFVKYFLIIMLVTVSCTILANSLIQSVFAKYAGIQSGKNMISSIGDRIDNNNQTIANLTDSLNENYLARARAFAEIIAQSPDIIYDRAEMDRIAQVLNVAEVHVTDEKGVLRWGNNPTYYGLDFGTVEQTRPFMPGLTDKNFELAQKPQPNSIGKLFQYISVARQDKPGIVQVGVAPEILDNALANNKMDMVIANFNVTEGKGVIAISKYTGLISGASNEEYIGQHYSDLQIPKDCFKLEKDNQWLTINGEKTFAVFGEYDDYVIVTTFSKALFSQESLGQNIVAGISSILLGLIIMLSIFILLKKVIISDIELVNHSLKCISQGDLAVVVNAKSTPEFSLLSQGINEMVSSLKSNITKIASQAEKLEESNKNNLASLTYARRIQNNLLPSLDGFNHVFQDYSILWEPKDLVGGDIYWIKSFSEGSVLCVCDCTGHGTPGALLTMMVVTALESVVKESNWHDPSEIMFELDKNLANILSSTNSATDIQDGADLAILCINKTGEIALASARTRLFICDGRTVQDIKGQKISLGSGNINSKDEIKNINIPANPDNRYYVASDGLFDQIGGESSMPFGYQKFKNIILENYSLSQQEIINEVWSSFELHMGEESRRDDITLLSFRL